MDYDTFKSEVVKSARERLGDECQIMAQEVKKNNGVILDGLVLKKKQNKKAPVVYLNNYYQLFCNGMTMDMILKDILKAYENDLTLPTVSMENFREVRKMVVYKLIQTEANEELLKEVPHIPFMDLSIVFYLLIQKNNNDQMAALIHNTHMETWKTSTKELYELAKINTPVMLPERIIPVKEVICKIIKEELGDSCEEAFFDEMLGLGPEKFPLYVLSNPDMRNGAACILYEDCLKKFARELEADILILPSSIHEVMLMPDCKADYDELLEMVRNINQTEVPKEDLLANSVYKYERETGHIKMVRQVKV